MKDMVGQERVVRWLQSSVRQNRLAHAYLFTALHMDEPIRMAIQLAKTLNCEKKDIDACDSCSTCIQIEHGNHPDVVKIQPDGAYIKIDQVRAVQASFRYRASNHITRILIIESAEKMRLETANSLLKFLEEPISPMVAILITDKKERILPTIQSRCQWVRFSPPSVHKQMEQYVGAGFTSADAQLLASLKYKEELNALSSLEFRDLLGKLNNWCHDFVTGNDSALLEVQVGWLADVCAQGQVKSVLELLLICLREKLTKQTHYFSQKNESESATTLAMENVLIASRLVQKTEVSSPAVLEQMVIATQEKRKSKPDDWRLIVI
ncbi:DNA polymerase III subunit delta' [Shimazuella sp. AN120528]|uniref:DNA polymerase III subunit delta' n=1 Tax=Shimazuella soli TaxID=1892854 RepID=UPI001F10CBF5|nr:DNA polymerase III subunit delta' [Shimazuella soli]MCH5584304.1 DNA polymerase III subunit delta' [Shimazuella soli]